ncbi:MAG: YkgJ family cysteine cluster protein [Candidatus Thorarchaeota archaeon]
MGRYRWYLGKPCTFLITSGAKKNTCSIHNERPDACRRFPTRPKEFCAVWPVK